MAIPDGLLTIVKNYLDVTWTDTDTDSKIAGIIERGIAYLNSYTGGTLDYEAYAAPQEMLLEYCYYAYHGEMDQFTSKYISQLVNLKINYGGVTDE